MPDVFKILKDLELKAVGLDDTSNKMQEGYFVAFRSVGLPIRKEDFDNPWDPAGGEDPVPVPTPTNTDPANAPKTDSAKLDPDKIYDEDQEIANIGKSQRRYRNTFMLTDSKLSMNAKYNVMPGASKVSDTWWAIVTGANGVPSQLQLSPALKAEYDAAQATLVDADGDPTKHYDKYLEYQDEYRDKLRAMNKAYAASFTDPRKKQMWPVEGRLYHDEVNEAWDRWMGLGHKMKIENAMAILAAQGTDPAIALIGRAKKKLNENLYAIPGAGLLPFTSMIPGGWADPNDDEGWTEYSSRDFHSETHYDTSSTSYGGGGGFSLGFWSVGGGFDHDEQHSEMNMSTTNLEVSFSYCAVDIFRPWLDTSLLNLDNWFLFGDYPANTISSGSFAQELPGDGKEHAFLPSIVTSLILIKDLRIKWDNWQSEWESNTSTTSGSLSVGYGPFAVRGHYGTSKHEFDASTDDESEGLHVAGIQLVGYVSQIMPASPRKNGRDFLEERPPAPADPVPAPSTPTGPVPVPVDG